MSIGPTSARARSGGASSARKLFSVLLAFALAWSLTPTGAWAQAGAANGEAGIDAGAPVGAEASAPVAGQEGGGDSASQAPDEADADAGQALAGAASKTPADADAGQTPVDQAPADQAPADQAPAPAPASLSATAAVVVQTSETGASSIANLMPEVGETLWANMTDAGAVVAPDASWTYQWMRAASQSTNVADYAPIEGATQRSLAVTEDLLGSYLIVKVTAAGQDYYGPAYQSANLTSSSWYIPGPVVQPGSAQLARIDLDNVYPEVGDTITATAYDMATYQPISSDVNATYTWSVADARDGDFTEVSSGADSAFTVTDAQVGKFIKVSVSAGVNTLEKVTNDAVPAPDPDEPAPLASARLLKGGQPVTSLAVGDTVSVEALREGSSDPVDASELAFTWQSSSDGEAFADIDGATGSSLSIGKELEGSYVRCTVASVDDAEDACTTSAAGPVAAAPAEVGDAQQQLDQAFTVDAIETVYGEGIDADGVTDDLALPAAAALGFDAARYTVTYSSSSDDVVIDGTTATVYRPKIGAEPERVTITATVTGLTRADAAVATKTLELALAPLTIQELDDEHILMNWAKYKTYFFEGIANGQEASAVASDLAPFAYAYYSADQKAGDTPSWAHGADTPAAAVGPVVAVAGEDGVTFSSSNPDVVANDTLEVTQPKYNTQVTVTATLASERYGRYAERYADDASGNAHYYKDVAPVPATTTFTVAGTTGQDAPRVQVTGSVIGVDENGNAQTWADATTLSLVEGSTAADLSEQLFSQAGLTVDYGEASWGWSLNTITSPVDGRTLGYDEATGKYWQLFVNGEASAAGADGVTLAEGDTVTWYYSAYGDALPAPVVNVTASLVGTDADGALQTWAAADAYALDEGATVADATRALIERTGITANFNSTDILVSVDSPFDGRRLKVDFANGLDWHVYVNGACVDGGWGDTSTKLADGDVVTWVYTAKSDTLPELPDDSVDPDAPRPDYDAAWPGFAGTPHGAVVEDVLTPTQSAELAWSYSYASGYAGVSDPLIVNGNVYLITGSTLMIVDDATGAQLASTDLGASIRYFSRPVYADGLIIVPTDDGSLSAYTADALTCVWRTPALDSTGTYQALSSLTVANGCVYAGFTVPGGMDPGTEGALVCVNVADGSTLWQTVRKSSETGEPEGYYWAGAAASGADILIGNEAGTVALIDGETGEQAASVSIGTPCRASIVSVDADENGDGAYLAVSRDDGTLYQIERAGDALTVTGSVRFAATSTSTPAVSQGKAFVCGADADGYGTLSVIDLDTMSVERSVRGGKGIAQSSPLVSVQNDGTYVYFTCNTTPGGVYGYKLGDEAAYLLYTPDAAHQNYCTASIVADADGNLYYTNDSSTLFKLAAVAGADVAFDAQGGSYVGVAKVALGKTVARPADPTRAGFAFGGWYADAACTQAWDFSTPITGATTLYAKWTPADTGEQGGTGEGGQGGFVPGGQGQGGQNPSGGVGGGSGAGAPNAFAPAATASPFAPLSAAPAPGATGAAAPVPAAGTATSAEGAAAASSAAASAADADATARSGKATGTDAAGASDEDVADADAAGGSAMNPLAIAGIVVGVAVLVGVVAFVVRARRRPTL